MIAANRRGTMARQAHPNARNLEPSGRLSPAELLIEAEQRAMP